MFFCHVIHTKECKKPPKRKTYFSFFFFLSNRDELDKLNSLDWLMSSLHRKATVKLELLRYKFNYNNAFKNQGKMHKLNSLFPKSILVFVRSMLHFVAYCSLGTWTLHIGDGMIGIRILMNSCPLDSRLKHVTSGLFTTLLLLKVTCLCTSISLL